MKEIITVLILENEPLISHCIEQALILISKKHQRFNFKTTFCNNCQDALTELNNKIPKFSLVIINLDVPPSNDKPLTFPEDIGSKSRESFSNTKIIGLTAFNDNYRISNTIKTLNLEGLLLKNDIDYNELVKAIESILLNELYYSKTVLRLLRRRIVNDLALDNKDRLILYHLSKGKRTKSLSNLIHLSISAIERRKRKLKEIFNVGHDDDHSPTHKLKAGLFNFFVFVREIRPK